MDIRELRSRLNHYPRLPLIRTPSPLDPLPRLSAQLNPHAGPALWIKRDDELGPGLGGNKGRTLAYLIADVKALNKQKVITYGGLQSNHARMTAAACAAFGLEVHLLFFERKPQEFTGNLLLNKLLGAKMHFIPIGGSSNKNRSLETTIRLVRLLSLPYSLGSGYFIPGGGHSLVGCLGYVEAACEIVDQVNELGLSPENTIIVSAVGTGGTLAGLMAGLVLLDSPLRVLGIDIGNLWKGFPESIARLATSACAALGSTIKFKAPDVPLIEKRYVGLAYAHPTAEGQKAIQQLARSEGILLDPVYTGKAFGGMVDLINQKQFDPDENLIFLHTGGVPAIWV